LAAATGERQINHARLINNKQVGARPDGRCNTRRNYELQIITENEADSTLFKQVITDSNLPSTFTATFVGFTASQSARSNSSVPLTGRLMDSNFL